jgi:hypothetical protein
MRGWRRLLQEEQQAGEADTERWLSGALPAEFPAGQVCISLCIQQVFHNEMATVCCAAGETHANTFSRIIPLAAQLQIVSMCMHVMSSCANTPAQSEYAGPVFTI